MQTTPQQILLQSKPQRYRKIEKNFPGRQEEIEGSPAPICFVLRWYADLLPHYVQEITFFFFGIVLTQTQECY